jgi:hypothetical protein
MREATMLGKQEYVMAINRFEQLRVYQSALDGAMQVFRMLKDLAEGGAVLADGPNQAFISLRVCQYR